MSDALTQIRSALAPKQGMRRIPFPLDCYQHTSLPLSNKRLLNWYPEKQPDDARSPTALLPTPGLQVYTAIGTIGSPPIVAMDATLPGRLYVVANDHFYRVSYDTGLPVTEDLGAIIVADMRPNDFITIAVGFTAVVVCSPPHCYTANHDTGASGAMHEIPITAVGTHPFPGAASVAHMDGYYAFSAFENSSQWFLSRLLDPSAFSALDFVYSDAMPNVVRRIVGNRGEFWVIGEKAIEVWYDSGNADFPFRRRTNGVIDIGTLAANGVATGMDYVWWIGDDSVVYHNNGYSAERVSNHAIEAIIRDKNAESLISGLYYEQDGHAFYALSWVDRTLVYDGKVGVWHERSSEDDGIGRWRAQCATQFGPLALLGDAYTGNILFPARRTDHDLADDPLNRVALIRQVLTPPLWAGTNRAFCARLEIEMETDTPESNQDARVTWSDDGGYTWKHTPSTVPPDGRTLSTAPVSPLLPPPEPDTPPNSKRVYTTRLGSFRERIFRITMSGSPTLYAFAADVQAGQH